MEAATIEEPLLEPEQAAALLSVPAATLQTWRAARTGPRFFRVGRHVRYARADLETWLNERANARKGAQ